MLARPAIDRRASALTDATDRLGRSAGALLLAAALLAPSALDRLAWLPLAGGLLIGLPHGAVDHLVPAWLLGRPLRARSMAALLFAYVAAAAASFAALSLAPVPAGLAFLVVSVLHFGSGDVSYRSWREGREPRATPVTVLAAGAPPILLPLALHPATVRGLLEAIAPGLGWLLAPAPRAALLVLTLGSAAIASSAMLRRGDRRAAAETAAVVALFCLVAPLPAFGAYFGFWHAARHIARLMATDPRNREDLAAGMLNRPLWRYARAAALPTLASLGVLVALWRAAAGPEGFAATQLAVLAALTMPHVAVVSWLERARLAGPGKVGAA